MSAGSFLRPPRCAEWGHPLVEAGTEPALPAKPGFTVLLAIKRTEEEQKINRSWAAILGVVINRGVHPWCFFGLFEATGWRRGESGSMLRLRRSFVLCVPLHLLSKALEWWLDVGHVCFPPTWLELAATLTTTSENVFPHWFWGLVSHSRCKWKSGKKNFRCFAPVFRSQNTVLIASAKGPSSLLWF